MLIRPGLAHEWPSSVIFPNFTVIPHIWSQQNYLPFGTVLCSLWLEHLPHPVAWLTSPPTSSQMMPLSGPLSPLGWGRPFLSAHVQTSSFLAGVSATASQLVSYHLTWPTLPFSTQSASSL